MSTTQPNDIQTPRTDAQVAIENPIGIPGNTAVISTSFARTLERELVQKEQEVETLMLRSVGAMAIAEGDEGWQNVPLECPMMDSVRVLRQTFDQNFKQYNIALAASHDEKLKLQSERDQLRKELKDSRDLVRRIELIAKTR